MVYTNRSVSSFGAWKTCWSCIRSPMIRPIQWSASTRAPINWSVRCARQYQPNPEPARIDLSTSAKAPAICFCCLRRSGLAPRGCHTAANGAGFCPTDARVGRCPLSKGDADHGGLGQSEHAYARACMRPSPAEARRILYRLEFRYTPKHGSWLNMAEVEFAV